MEHSAWQRYVLGGRLLEARQEGGVWHLRTEGAEVSAAHLDHAFQRLLNVPSHVALRLALDLLNADPGSEISSRD